MLSLFYSTLISKLILHFFSVQLKNIGGEETTNNTYRTTREEIDMPSRPLVGRFFTESLGKPLLLQFITFCFWIYRFFQFYVITMHSFLLIKMEIIAKGKKIQTEFWVPLHIQTQEGKGTGRKLRPL